MAADKGLVLGIDILSFDPFAANNPSVELENWQLFTTNIPMIP